MEKCVRGRLRQSHWAGQEAVASAAMKTGALARRQSSIATQTIFHLRGFLAVKRITTKHFCRHLRVGNLKSDRRERIGALGWGIDGRAGTPALPGGRRRRACSIPCLPGGLS